MTKIRTAILKNEQRESHSPWVKACLKMPYQVLYKIIDLTLNSWLDEVNDFNPDLLLTVPGGFTAHFKQLYDERLAILVKELGYISFPTLEETLIYENKRYLSYWLKAHKIPHPITSVFYHKEEALNYSENARYPLVAKLNIGAAGRGVTILENRDKANNYIAQIFSGKGINRKSGPNLKKGKILKRGVNYLITHQKISEKIQIYKTLLTDKQKDFLIFQEYIPHEFEWRAVRIGNSFFAHKKMKIGNTASGSTRKCYENPPVELLEFTKMVTDRFNFRSLALDLFETVDSFLINEMQCIFGQSDPYQMLIDDIPGRYIHDSSEWIFEPGEFNSNESFDLRLAAALEILKKLR